MEAKATDKIIQIDTLRRLASFVSDRLSLLNSTHTPEVLITGKFVDGSTYSNDSISAFDHPAFENRFLKSLNIEGKLGYSTPINILIDKHEIRYKISDSSEEWVTSSNAALDALIGSLASIDTSESFFYRYRWLRYFLVCISSIAVSIFLVFLIAKPFPRLADSYYPGLISPIILSFAVYFFDHKLPSFRELWPSIEFDLGPIDQRPSSLRKNALKTKNFAVGIALSFVIPAAFFLLDKAT